MNVPDDVAYTWTMLVIGATFVLFGIALLWAACGSPRWLRRLVPGLVRRGLARRRRASEYQARHRPAGAAS